MPKAKTKSSPGSAKKMRSAILPEARENQLIALAMDLAEQQLKDGTASSQLITEFVKRGSIKYRLENEKLREENNKLRAQTKAVESAEDLKEIYANAISAMRKYSGQGDEEEYDEEWDD